MLKSGWNILVRRCRLSPSDRLFRQDRGSLTPVRIDFPSDANASTGTAVLNAIDPATSVVVSSAAMRFETLSQGRDYRW